MLILTKFEFYVSEICPRISSHLMLRGRVEIAYQELWHLTILQNIPLVTFIPCTFLNLLQSLPFRIAIISVLRFYLLLFVVFINFGESQKPRRSHNTVAGLVNWMDVVLPKKKKYLVAKLYRGHATASEIQNGLICTG